MLHRLAALFALALVACSVIGCGGGGIDEGPPPEETGYVEPTDAAEPPAQP